MSDQPQFILDYLDAYETANPGNPLPEVWDKGNGWIHFRATYSQSVRRRQIEDWTSRLRYRVNQEKGHIDG